MGYYSTSVKFIMKHSIKPYVKLLVQCMLFRGMLMRQSITDAVLVQS